MGKDGRIIINGKISKIIRAKKTGISEVLSSENISPIKDEGSSQISLTLQVP